MHVAASRAVGHIEQERSDCVAWIYVWRGGVGRLLQRISGVRVVVERLKRTAAEFAAETKRVIPDHLRNVGLPLVNVGLVRIERFGASRNAGISVDADCRQQTEASDKVSSEVLVEAEALNGARGQVRVDRGAVRFLMRPSILRLKNQGGAESVDPTRAVILAGIVGNALVTPGRPPLPAVS